MFCGGFSGISIYEVLHLLYCLTVLFSHLNSLRVLVVAVVVSWVLLLLFCLFVFSGGVDFLSSYNPLELSCVIF